MVSLAGPFFFFRLTVPADCLIIKQKHLKHLTKNSFLFLVLLLSLALPSRAAGQVNGAGILSLNGRWEMGFARKYTSTVNVPSIATDPTKMGEDVLWYRRQVKLPA